jgi:DNA-binding transcriptional regulator YdaS (Cro superfamily)
MRTSEVIEYFGGVKKVADALEIWPQAVYQWGDIVPEKTAYKIETITNGVLRVMGSDYEPRNPIK